MPHPVQPLTQLVQLAQSVGVQLRHFYQHTALLNVQHKADQSPVTAADLAAHATIVQGLQQISPLLPVLSEESADHEGRHDWSSFWLVDPLDGTKEFINRTDEFTVNISLIVNGQVACSVIGVPMKNAVYATDGVAQVWRVDDAGWHVLRPQPAQTCWRIAVSREAKKQQGGRYVQFLQHLDSQQRQYVQHNAGSAYKFCLMAEGLIDVYPRLHPTSEWDTAAGQAMLQALGGALVDEQGRAFGYNQRPRLENGVFVAVRCLLDLPEALAAMQQIG